MITAEIDRSIPLGSMPCATVKVRVPLPRSRLPLIAAVVAAALVVTSPPRTSTPAPVVTEPPVRISELIVSLKPLRSNVAPGPISVISTPPPRS